MKGHIIQWDTRVTQAKQFRFIHPPRGLPAWFSEDQGKIASAMRFCTILPDHKLLRRFIETEKIPSPKHHASMSTPANLPGQFTRSHSMMQELPCGAPLHLASSKSKDSKLHLALESRLNFSEGFNHFSFRSPPDGTKRKA